MAQPTRAKDMTLCCGGGKTISCRKDKVQEIPNGNQDQSLSKHYNYVVNRWTSPGLCANICGPVPDAPKIIPHPFKCLQASRDLSPPPGAKGRVKLLAAKHDVAAPKYKDSTSQQVEISKFVDQKYGQVSPVHKHLFVPQCPLRRYQGSP